ncbi:hypothetical protein N7493_010639 [Penicillium malachiteum]|uniref:Zn(2)-C6 fungal-type domain-containing protein n=1 Tax=Penicillium malachiteum TaxID=1324776 RepID=A0AAD6HDB6_9EURO|nr:hypothetical protein N7493_010639 [Penicillium malachiteum]
MSSHSRVDFEDQTLGVYRQTDHILEGAIDSHEPDETPMAKRRKVRKGTRSCWECRQRKMKCIFNKPTDNECTRCRRRGVKCVSQEFPEEITSSLDRNLQLGDRMARLESLVEKLLDKSSRDVNISDRHELRSDGADESRGALMSTSLNSETSLAANVLNPSEVCLAHQRHHVKKNAQLSYQRLETTGFDVINGTQSIMSGDARISLIDNTKYAKLSRVLHASLPSLEDIKKIVQGCGNTSPLFYQMQTLPYKCLDETTSLDKLFDKPTPDAHPVLIAKHMLHTATALQHLHPDFASDMNGLSEPPRAMMRRLAGVAMNIVTTNDDLISCVEGLDCLLVESWHHTNNGNLRKGLITVRRAMTIAQLMGFHRPGKGHCKIVHRQTKAYPEFIWFRINSLERYLCLMLGLPQSTLDLSMASERTLSGDTPMGRLDRIHCVITSRILERNESTPELQGFSLTRELDEELQKASKGLPAKWWLTPNLATVSDKPEALFWDMRRLFHHLFHYNLLIQLHLPYMLHCLSSGQRYEYPQITCVNSAREVLSRFIMFHSFNQIAFSCRTIEFMGLMAAITLLIAHIDGHQRWVASRYLPRSLNPAMPTENSLAHQRPGDRSLIENVQDILNQVTRLEDDTMSVQISTILQRLMDIEAEIADGPMEDIGQTTATLERSKDPVRLSIPYFGAISIAQEGILFSNPAKTQSRAAEAAQSQARTLGPSNMNNSHSELRGTLFAADAQIVNVEARNKTPNDRTDNEALLMGTVQPDDLSIQINGINHSSHERTTDNGFTQQHDDISSASNDDGAQQNLNLDMAFFDTLMREVGNDRNDSIDWLAWLNDGQFLNS